MGTRRDTQLTPVRAIAAPPHSGGCGRSDIFAIRTIASGTFTHAPPGPFLHASCSYDQRHRGVF